MVSNHVASVVLLPSIGVAVRQAALKVAITTRRWHMAGRVSILDRVVVGIAVAVIALRIPRFGHNRIRANEPPNLRQIVPRVHVDEADILCRIRPGVVVDVPGEAAVADAGVDDPPRQGAMVAEGVVAGQ